jgi:oligoendopeptidase F
VKRDLERAGAECVEFEEAYKGKLATFASDADAGAKLAEAVKRYEALDDLLGRLISFASLFYVGNTADPVRMKFYGDMQERITAASLHLLFFTLELNRLEDAALENAMANPALGYYRPWIEDVRKEKPYQLEDRVEELFHEKSVTGAGAWNRLFDETMGALRFKVGGKSLAIEQTLSLMQDASEKKRRAASEALAKTFKENRRVFTLITNTLAKDKEISDRWRGFKDIADARHLSNRVEPEVVEALVGGARGLSAALASLLRPQSKVVRQEAPAALGSQRTAAESRATYHCVGSGARNGAHRLWGVLAPHGGCRRALLRAQLDRCAGASRQAGRRVRASDGPVRAPVCAAQLSGQAA